MEVPAGAPEGLGDTGVLTFDMALGERKATAATAPQPPLVACRPDGFYQEGL